MAGKQERDTVPRRFAHVRLGVVCVERELPLHDIEEQPLAQMPALEQLRIRAAQPTGDLCKCGLVEPLFVGCGWVLSGLRAPAQNDIEFNIRWLSQRLREVDKTRDASLVNDYVGSM